VKVFKLIEGDPEAGCREIRIEGDLDLAVAAELQEALDRAAAENDRILIGLAGCDFIDSTGIAVILRAYNQMHEEGRKLSVYAPSGQVLRVLSMTGLTGNGLVFESRDRALVGSPTPS
jgi:anti-anti-sigma factor